jgi:glycine cleavage system H protein
MSEQIPKDLRYTSAHEWTKAADDGVVTIGITVHAVEQLGDITMVTLPEVGTSLAAGEAFGDVDSVKAVSELFAPIDGEVVAVNEQLDDTPETVNEAPYGAGWMLKIRPFDPTQLDALLDPAAYDALVQSEQ